MRKQFWVAVTVITLLAVGCGGNPSDQKYLESAIDHFERGDLRTASIELKNSLQQNPDNPRARWYLGRLHLLTGNLADAEKELLRAKELGVVDDSVLPDLASSYLREERLDRLLQLEVGKLSPRSAVRVLSTQATAYLHRKDFERAGILIERAFALEPKGAESTVAQARLAFSQGNHDRSRSILEELLLARPDYAPAWTLLGDVENSIGRLPEAEAAYTKAIENEVNGTPDLLKRSLVRVKLEKYELAQQDIDLLKRRIGSYYELDYAQGLLFFKLKMYQQAQEALELSVQANRYHLPAQFHLGATYLQLGNIDRAAETLNLFHQAHPRSVVGRQLLAEVARVRGDYAEVLRLMGPVVWSSTVTAPSLTLYADALARSGKFKEAETFYQRLVELEPDSPTALARLGEIQLRSGAVESGKAALSRAIELNPQDQAPVRLLVRRHVQDGEMERARGLAEKNLAANPDSPDAIVLAAQVLLLSGEMEQGKELLEKARGLQPGHVVANHELAGLAMSADDRQEAYNRYQEVLAHNDGHLSTLVNLARLKLGEGATEEAVTLLQSAISAHPDAEEPRVLLARQRLAEGDFESVALVLGEKLLADSGSAAPLELLSRSQLAGREYGNARATLRRLAALRPQSAEVAYLQSLVALGMGNAAEERRELERAVAFDPKHLHSRLRLARLELQNGALDAAGQHLAAVESVTTGELPRMRVEAELSQARGEPERALQLRQEIFSRSSQRLDMHALSRQYWVMGRRGDSLALYEKWVEENPEDLSAKLMLASAYSHADREEASKSLYQEVLDKTGGNAIALNNLAWQLKDRDLAQATLYAERAASIAPESAEIADTLSTLLYESGEYERALRYSRQALELRPGHAPFIYRLAKVNAAVGRKAEAVSTLKQLVSRSEWFEGREAAEALLEKLSR